jgi:hypothetical protein
MEVWLFLGGFAAVILLIAAAVVYIRRKLRRFKMHPTDARILSAIISGLHKGELDFELEEGPRSVNGCDSLLLPQILKDFPDFDPDQAKNLFRTFLRDQYRGKSGFTIYNVVFSKYHRSSLQKVIVMQAACSYSSGGKKKQIRCEADYCYHVETADETIATNCPNCGGALGYGITVCPFCDSRVVNIMGNTWRFQNLRES